MTTITRPSELPEWAVNDVTLPGANTPNKVAPSLALRQIGFDYLALPTAQEENSWRNNVFNWIGFNTERVDQNILDITALTDRVATAETELGSIDSVVNLNDAYVDIGDLRIVFASVSLTVATAMGSTAVATATLTPVLAAAPIQVQLTNNLGDGREGTEVTVALGATTASTVAVEANRISGVNAGDAEEFTVNIMAIGRKP